MNATSLSAEDVAQFLTENREFFQDHADLFSNLHVPHPHESRAISLGERQIMILRARTRLRELFTVERGRMSSRLRRLAGRSRSN